MSMYNYTDKNFNSCLTTYDGFCLTMNELISFTPS
jgi:hypothetical protein